MKIRKRLQFLCYLSSLLLILSSCSSGGGGSSDNATVGSGDSGEDVVSSSCIYESIPASNVIFSSDSKISFSTAKSAGKIGSRRLSNTYGSSQKKQMN